MFDSLSFAMFVYALASLFTQVSAVNFKRRAIPSLTHACIYALYSIGSTCMYDAHYHNIDGTHPETCIMGIIIDLDEDFNDNSVINVPPTIILQSDTWFYAIDHV